MFTFIHKFSILFCLLFILHLGNTIHAQDDNARTSKRVAVDAQTKQKLISLSQKFDADYQINKNRALDLAKKNGWFIKQVDSSGNTTELMGVDDNGIPIYYSTDNANAAKTIRTNLVYPSLSTNLNLTGKYYTLGIWDAGAVRATHKEFGGRVIYKDTVRTLASHPSHVAGTMIATGKSTSAKGMAYEATLWAYSYDNDLAEMAKAASQGLLISNHSYGANRGWSYSPVENEWYWAGDTTISDFEDYYFGFYDEKSKLVDELTFNAKNYLPVMSSGNERSENPPTLNIKHKVLVNGKWVYSTKTRKSDNGYDGTRTWGIAKNVLTVGAVNPLNNYTKPSDVVMSDFSSWGPTDDGRIKPDIVGDGVGVYSTEFESDSAYGYKSGTSMATPSVSGSLLLIQNQYNLNTGDFLNAAALKAVAIHTADEAGPDTGPDYQFGWGLMNTKKAVDLINNQDGLHQIKNGLLLNNIKLDYPLPTDGNSGYRITIVWTDPAGSVSAPSLNSRTPKLVNDLDIRIVDPSDGETFYPWRLDPNNPAAAATKGDNIRDNVEVIDVPYLPESNYVVRVSHKGQLANNQLFTVIISKIPINVPLPNFIAIKTTICPGGTVSFTNITQNIDFFTKYTWSFPGGTPSSYVGKTPPAITYNQAGTYNVLLIGNNGPFTKNTLKSNYITVADPHPGSAFLFQQCESGNYILVDTTGKINIKKVDWYVNNIKLFSNKDIYLKSDDFKNGDIVKAIIEAISNCNTVYTIETQPINLKIPITLKPIINITANANQYCSNKPITFTANTLNKSDNDYYVWYVNGEFYASSIANTLELNYYTKKRL